MIGLFAAFVVQLILERWMNIPVGYVLALTPARLDLWQLATYVLVYSGPPPMFLLGLLFIWWALSPFELNYGSTRTLQLCVVSVFSASVPAWLAGFILPPSLLSGSVPLWYGAAAATSWLQRHQQIALFGALRMSAQQFLWILLAMSGLTFLASVDPGGHPNYTQLVAELGALGGGIAYARWMMRPRMPKPGRRSKPQSRSFKVIPGGGGGGDDDRPKLLN